MSTLASAIGLTLLLVLLSPHLTASEKCGSGYFQGCKSCVNLKKIVSKTEPDAGDYYRGAQWNGLYAAYVHNCINLAEDLLKWGANPNWGGSQGSMVISVSDKWPHNDKEINRKWAGLLLKYGANAKKTVPDQDKTSEQIMSDLNFAPDYPDLFQLFIR